MMAVMSTYQAVQPKVVQQSFEIFGTVEAVAVVWTVTAAG